MYSVPYLTTVRTVEYSTGSYKDKGDVRKDPNLTTPKITFLQGIIRKSNALYGVKLSCIPLFLNGIHIKCQFQKGTETFIVSTF